VLYFSLVAPVICYLFFLHVVLYVLMMMMMMMMMMMKRHLSALVTTVKLLVNAESQINAAASVKRRDSEKS